MTSMRKVFREEYGYRASRTGRTGGEGTGGDGSLYLCFAYPHQDVSRETPRAKTSIRVDHLRQRPRLMRPLGTRSCILLKQQLRPLGNTGRKYKVRLPFVTTLPAAGTALCLGTKGCRSGAFVIGALSATATCDTRCWSPEGVAMGPANSY
jgi:hypothetical protein